MPRTALLLPLFLLLVTVPTAHAQAPSAQTQIAAAVQAAPQALRDGARVLGYDAEGGLGVLRDGTNELICLADDPTDDRFHVACYHAALEPFMVRGRELRAEGKKRDEIQKIREEEIRTGALEMADHPMALYSLTGPAGSYDAAADSVSGASPLYVVYMPYATAETTGLDATPKANAPWLMDSGKPWAHIMIIPKREEEQNQNEEK